MSLANSCLIERIAPRVERARRETTTTAGMLAARTWLFSCGLAPPVITSWQVEISLDVVDAHGREAIVEPVDTQLTIHIHADEWGFRLSHAGFASSIRVTDIPHTPSRDEFGLLSSTPALKDLGAWLRKLEARLGVTFRRHEVFVRTNLPGAAPTIASWIESL